MIDFLNFKFIFLCCNNVSYNFKSLSSDYFLCKKTQEKKLRKKDKVLDRWACHCPKVGSG